MEKTIETKHFSLMYWKAGFWFRVFGMGITARNISASPQNALAFSERNGLTRYLRIGQWVVRWLKRSTKVFLRCDLTACNHNIGELCTNKAVEKTLKKTGYVLCIPWITPEEKDKIFCMDKPIAAEDVLQALEELQADVERMPIRIICLQEEVEGNQ